MSQPWQSNSKLSYDGCANQDTLIQELLETMTIEEKVGQVVQASRNKMEELSGASDIVSLNLGSVLSGGGESPDTNTGQGWLNMVKDYQARAAETDKGIPLIYGVDAVHGHNNLKTATIFPHNIGLGCTDDEELVYEIGKATALEVRATGISWNFAPAVSVPQDIRWGRTYEGYSQDNKIVTKMALAYLRGLQHPITVEGRTYPAVAGCVKHFLGDGQTKWGTTNHPQFSNWTIDQGDVDTSEQQLRAVSLPPFKATIDAGALSVMISYNSFKGDKMHGSKYWVTDVLKGELGFDGLVVSDWEGFFMIDGEDSDVVVQSFNAGIDLMMAAYRYQEVYQFLLQGVQSGQVTMERLNDAVTRILQTKCVMNLFEKPVPTDTSLAVIYTSKHKQLARTAVQKSLVLLKNDNSALPLGCSNFSTLYLAGKAANINGFQNGGWTYTWQGSQENDGPSITLRDAFESYYGSSKTIIYSQDTSNLQSINSQTTTCVQVIAENPYTEGHGDVANPSASPEDIALFNALRPKCKTHVVVVYSGRPIDLGEEVRQGADAIVAAWLPGSEGGPGIVDVLTGVVGFSGKLTYTWPKSFDGYQGQDKLKPEDILYDVGYGMTYP